MKSNFEFLKNEDDLQKYYANAVNAERLYADGYYSEEVINVRKIAEELTKDIMDLEYLQVDERATFNDNLTRLRKGAYVTDRAISVFYEVKRSGNVQAHALEETATKESGLKELKNIRYLLADFAHNITTSMSIPVQMSLLNRKEKLITLLLREDWFTFKLLIIQVKIGQPILGHEKLARHLLKKTLTTT